MNILIVFAIAYHMATFARSAPLPESSALVEGAQFQEIVQRSGMLTKKILQAIPEAHKSSITTETLKLDSPENAKLELMASNIGIPSAPVVRAVSENLSVESSLTRITEGLQLHRNLLSSVSPRLENKDKVTALMSDIRDLVIQINKMLKIVQAEAALQPSPTPVTLQLPGEYEVQVAAHLTLVQLQAFGQDTVRFLRSLDTSNDEETES